MKKISMVLLVFSLMILLVSISSFTIRNKVIQTNELFSSVNITDSIGFDLNGSALIFGNLNNNGNNVRNVIFTNTYDFPVIVKIKSKGKISDFLEFENLVKVEKGEEKKISFTVYSENTEYGLYTGNVKFDILRDYSTKKTI